MEIINKCTKPPSGIEWQVRRSLRWIEPSHLQGLGRIVLDSEMLEVPKASREAEWVKLLPNENSASVIHGWYEVPRENEPAFIILYAGPIYRPVPSFLWWSTVPTLRILSTLAHEVAHHLVATRGYVFEKGDITDEEATARHFSAKVLQATTESWSYRFGRCCIKELADWYYSFARADWKSKDSKAAARHFYNAWDLCPEREDASYWYWRAREMCDTNRS